MAALNTVNDRYGRFMAVPAAQGFTREWKARSDSKSPAWTTRLSEVPLINARR